ncbi:leucine-rich melanocyte differentiation-associated protein-like [Ornithodoros turicata]|uniref:leucine-rich melanocyte differentiation-associated protein-like n=1 Tax=Ornithodoros turicata TaxID=34597 RepID=UPI0031395D3D
MATDGYISFVHRECSRIPTALIENHSLSARCLDLSYNQLRTLTGIEHFTQLRELILDNNQLNDTAEFVHSSHLTTLSLNKNCFCDLERLVSTLQQYYPNLTFLSLLGNPACPDQITNPEKDEDDYRRYRYYVIHKLVNLRFLDSRCVSNGERREAQRIGAFMRVARPAEGDEAPDDVYPSPFTQLPSWPFTQKRTLFGTLTYKYTGKHSEGNRFICNDQL